MTEIDPREVGLTYENVLSWLERQKPSREVMRDGCCLIEDMLRGAEGQAWDASVGIASDQHDPSNPDSDVYVVHLQRWRDVQTHNRALLDERMSALLRRLDRELARRQSGQGLRAAECLEVWRNG